MLERYEDHPRLDICGTWQTEDGSIRLWFPVVELSDDQRKALLDRHRSADMVRRANRFVDEACVKLVEVPEPTATDDDLPIIQPEEVYLDEPTGGVMLIEARHNRPCGERALEICAEIAVDVYSEFMLEKVER